MQFLILFAFEICFSIAMASCSIIHLNSNSSYGRSSVFPDNFLFGTASSAYQFEGAYLSDGKGPNIWDIYTHKPGNIIDGSNADVAVDHYHHYLDDLDLMQDIGVNSYRFSISWARILPKGRFGKVNKAGIHFYNSMIDALLQRGIEPFVTLHHFDVPQELEDRYGSWLSAEIQQDFQYYADTCFKNFGDRVKYWVTLNEPNVAVIRGYRKGTFPPGHCSGSYRDCRNVHSERETLMAAHNAILSHVAAVNLYRAKYQIEQRGQIGIVVNAIWYEPLSNSTEDKLAAERAQSFYMNWFLDPIVLGKYPKEMYEILGDMPSFSSHEQNTLKNGADFIGLNHYTSFYVKDCIFSQCESGVGSSKEEGFAVRTPEKNGVLIGEHGAIDWLYVYPEGMEKMITYIKLRYNNVPMFITENGYADKYNAENIEVVINDVKRVDYLSSYLEAIGSAMRNGADVRGYFIWSLLDNFEWTYGYTMSFGICHVDYVTLSRTKKLSATWYKQLIAGNKPNQAIE